MEFRINQLMDDSFTNDNNSVLLADPIGRLTRSYTHTSIGVIVGGVSPLPPS